MHQAEREAEKAADDKRRKAFLILGRFYFRTQFEAQCNAIVRTLLLVLENFYSFIRAAILLNRSSSSQSRNNPKM